MSDEGITPPSNADRAITAKPRRFTLKEDEFLKSNVRNMSTTEIGRALNRSQVTIKQRLVILGLSDQIRFEKPSWTEEETKTLRKAVTEGITNKDIATMLGRSHVAIVQRIAHLCLRQKVSLKRFSKQDDEYLKANVAKKNQHQLALALGRTDGVIRQRLGILGLLEQRTTNRRRWSDEDNNELTRMFNAGFHMQKIAENLGRSCGSVRLQASKLNLHRTAPVFDHAHLKAKWVERKKDIEGVGRFRDAMKKPERREKISKSLKATYEAGKRYRPAGSYESRFGPVKASQIKSKLKAANAKPSVKAALREARLRQVFPKHDTIIELLIQQELNARGIAFFTHYPIRGQPDVVLADSKIAIFADGCYWHGCSTHFPLAKFAEPEYDANVTAELESQGWTVFRFWEHEIKSDVSSCINMVLMAVNDKEEVVANVR